MTRFFRLLVILVLLAPAARAEEGNFVKAGEVDLVTLLAPPPVQDGPQTRAELEELVRIQAASPPERVELAKADVTEDVWRFADAVGPGFTAEKLPLTAAFFARVADDEGVTVDPAKKVWARPRPFLFDPRVKALVEPSKSGSYPSGHATVGYLMAIVLADMLPEKRRAIFDRAAEFAYSRMVGGMHYRTDTEAGRIAGTLIAQAMLNKPEFQAEYARSREELRGALALGQ